MYAIISALDQDSSALVREIWQVLADRCQLRGIFNFPTPHFSWFAADSLEVERVKPILRQIAAASDSIKVHTFGLGIFSGQQPVLYLPVVKTQDLMDYHRNIWDQTQPYSENTKLYYSPSLWLPHITLAIKDLTLENLACALASIGGTPLTLTIRVENVMIVEQEGHEIGETLVCYAFD
jgi:2'-5' RNA ligase